MISELLTHASYIVSPPFCVACREFLTERVPLCLTCEEQLERIVSYDMVIKKKYHVRVFALSQYTGVVRSLILAKQHGQRVASKQLGQLILKHCLCDWQTYDYVIPVPLHWTRYAKRGFNQASVIAETIAVEQRCTVMPGVVRCKRTMYQARLSREGREKNVKKVFTVLPEYKKKYSGKHLLIVDDLMTTGATLREIASELATCNPASITACVAARVV